MRVPKAYARGEETVRGSRFLSEVFLISSQSEVRERIKSQKRKYADSTHVCHAFICGRNAEIMGMSDDGEPSGTAGRPMLDVLKGSGSTNILVTVTRWFGGTLLGTGGLVHAYGNAVRNVLSQCEFEELVEKSDFSINCDYQQYRVIRKILDDFSISGMSEDFGEMILVRGKIPEADIGRLREIVFDSTKGKVLPIIST